MTGSGSSVLTIERSAEVVTVVASVSVLLPVTGSGVIDATTAVLLSVPNVSESTVTVRVMDDEAPAASTARVQVTTPAFSLQVQPVPDALIYVTPAGSVSVTD